SNVPKCIQKEGPPAGPPQGGGKITRPADGLLGDAVFQNLAVLRRQWRLLSETPRLGLIVRRLAGNSRNHEPFPLAAPIGIHALGLSTVAEHEGGPCNDHRGGQASLRHGFASARVWSARWISSAIP